MKNLLIFPFNGNGLEALNCLGTEFNFLGFVDDTPEKQGIHALGFEVFSREALKTFPTALVLAVPGSPTSYMIRKKIIDDLGIADERFATVIHPKASVSPFAKIGKNTLLMAGVVLTSNCIIGNHVCILPNSVVHHDSIVGDYTLIGSNVTIAGNTSIGNNCYVGSGTSIINGISVGENTLIGMGTNVIKSIAKHSKIVGNPARIL
jgi:sugar O-acyltransferase (sialic acid O-acetyltransferase NeuD family)